MHWASEAVILLWQVGYGWGKYKIPLKCVCACAFMSFLTNAPKYVWAGGGTQTHLRRGHPFFVVSKRVLQLVLQQPLEYNTEQLWCASQHHEIRNLKPKHLLTPNDISTPTNICLLLNIVLKKAFYLCWIICSSKEYLVLGCKTWFRLNVVTNEQIEVKYLLLSGSYCSRLLS